MFFAFLLHHLLNRGWTKRLFQGKYTPYRMLQTAVAALVFLAMLGSFASAVFISQEVFAFLPIRQGMALGRTVHLLCAYWGYLLLSLHLGLHWGMMVAMAGKKLSPSPRRRVVFNILGAAAALYGVFALFQRQIPTYLFLQSQFVFFNFDEPLVFFFLDYLAVMAAFVWLGHALAKASQRRGNAAS